jgi:hypothetical protein
MVCLLPGVLQISVFLLVYTGFGERFYVFMSVTAPVSKIGTDAT